MAAWGDIWFLKVFLFLTICLFQCLWQSPPPLFHSNVKSHFKNYNFLFVTSSFSGMSLFNWTSINMQKFELKAENTLLLRKMVCCFGNFT